MPSSEQRKHLILQQRHFDWSPVTPLVDEKTCIFNYNLFSFEHVTGQSAAVKYTRQLEQSNNIYTLILGI